MNGFRVFYSFGHSSHNKLKHKNDFNFGPNLNIDKICSVIDSPGHSREAKKEQKPLSHKVC